MVDTPLQAALRKAFDSKASVLSGNPTGTIIFYLGTDVPEGYLLCNGAAVSRTTYAKLFAVLGTRCGAGNGSTTFNLPNFHGRVPQATTNVADVGKTLEASLPNITGRVPGLRRMDSLKDHQGALYWSAEVTGQMNCNYNVTVQGDPKIDASRSSSIYSGSKLQVPALQVLACIRV